MKSAEAYKGSALGWLRSKVPDSFVKAKDAYTQRAVEVFSSFKLDDAIAFAKEKSSQSYTIITQVCAVHGRARAPLARPSFRVRSPSSPAPSPRRRHLSSSSRARRPCRRRRRSPPRP